MSDLTTKLQYLADTKTAIKEALVEKGVEVADTDTFRSYADKISSIESGGGNDQLDAVIDGTITEISSNVTSIRGYGFRSCGALTTADFPNATTIGENAFYGCKALENVAFPNVTSIGSYVFYDCKVLETANFPNATSIERYDFYSCSKLKTVNFPKATSIGTLAFSGCGLKTANFPNVTSIENQVFSNCTALTALILRKTTMVSLSNKNAFNGTKISSGTGYIYVPRDLVASYQSATNWSTYANQFRALEDYTVDGTITGEPDLAKMGITLS